MQHRSSKITRLTFLGTGTSQGVPMIACPCAVCSSPDPRDKRLRSSVLIEAGETVIVIDAGPDFRQQMLRAEVQRMDALLLTHEHKDHTGGIDDVRAFNYFQNGAVDIYATERVQRHIKKDFDYAFEDNPYPGVPLISLKTIGTDPFTVNDVEVIPIKGLHYRLPVTGFRIGGIAYLTDCNSIADSEIEKLRGVDVFIVNALRHTKHISHYNVEEALGLASSVGAERTYLTHTSHQLGFHAEEERKLPEGTFFAYDGLIIESSR